MSSVLMIKLFPLQAFMCPVKSYLNGEQQI